MNTSKKMYIVDDDEIFLYTSTRIIERVYPGKYIATCLNGLEATHLIKNQQPDLILIDLNMPLMNGWELLDWIKENISPVNFKIIVVTSSIDPRDKIRIDNHALQPFFIEKPLSLEKLENYIFE